MTASTYSFTTNSSTNTTSVETYYYISMNEYECSEFNDPK